MIDIHTHILPNIDDGSSSIEESFEMLRIEKESGVDTVILTPHFKSCKKKYNDNNKLKIDALFADFLKQCESIGVKVLCGCEVHYDKNTLNYLRDGLIKTMNDSNYVLIEFGFSYESFDVSEELYNIRTLGFIPIVAHVERYCSYLSFDQIKEIKESGCLIQINVGSLLNLDGKSECNMAKKLLKHGLVDFIASDCHNTSDRKPNLREVQKLLKKYPYINKDIFQ